MVAVPTPATTTAEVAASVARFDDVLSDGADIDWALQSDYWVCDVSTGTFAPAKFAAFADMDVVWYRELLDAKTVGAFDGHRTQRHLARMFEVDWESSPSLLARLQVHLSAALGRPWQYKNLAAVRFLVIPFESRIWWVNQGKTASVALDAGYLWAPQNRKDKSSGERTQPPYYYWSNVARVRAGDLVFNYARSLVAISIANTDGAPAPETDSATDEWTGDGWRVDLDTHRLKTPIALDAFGQALTAATTPQGPMQPNGEVKLGYLFQLSPGEASILADRIPWPELPARFVSKLRELGLQASQEEGGYVSTSIPHNQILFGPPGTGKTYRSAELAVRICDGTAPATRPEVMERYKALRLAGRIAFVTFHQSYAYEEFVEGIRPLLVSAAEDRGATVQYECRSGVFKRLCEAAQVSRNIKHSAVVDLKSVRVWKMSLGNTQDPENTTYEEAIESGTLLLGWGGGLDFTGCDTREAVRDRLQVSNEDYGATAVHAFKNKMAINDIVIVSDGNHKFRAIGRIAGEYKPPAPKDNDQRRPVEWLATFLPSLPHDQIANVIFVQQSIYELKRDVLKLDELNALLASKNESKDGDNNHVLIIDEINRGNVSKIFGELITLLESDKRLGALNEVAVTLPHSGEHFAVPQNVYLVGTMNTADRSIAFLDTALRRRFAFFELMPEPDLLVALVGNVADIDISQLLRVLNERIELLYDRDHTIGHAFFVGISSLPDLRDVFLHKVIPLLQEYFYGDWSRLCRVLACPYNPDTGKPETKNTHPMILSAVLNTAALGALDIDEVRVTSRINPAFACAEIDTDLRPFFQQLLGPTAKSM